MKDDRFAEMLSDMEVPQAVNDAHRQALKGALVDAALKDSQPHRKGFFNMRRKIFASAAVGLAGLVAIAVAIVMMTPGDQASAAQELAQQSSSYISGMNPGDRASLIQRFRTAYHADPQQLLDEAQHANDLTVLTYDQLKTGHPDIFAKIPSGGPGDSGASVSTGGAGGNPGVAGPVTRNQVPPSGEDGQTPTVDRPLPVISPPAGAPSALPDLTSMKFLLFTNDQGQKILLGIGRDNGPVLTMTIDSNGDVNGSVSSSNQGESWGSVTVPAPGAGTVGGAGSGVRCSKNGDGPMQCTQVGGGQP